MKNLTLEKRIKNMRRGERFEVVGKNARNQVQRVILFLKRLDLLTCEDIKTRELETDKFEVYAL